jgi:hypothetical protein
VSTGYESWIAFTRAVEATSAGKAAPPRAHSVEDYERLASDFVLAFDAPDDAALKRLNDHYGRMSTFDDVWAEVWRRVYSFRHRAFKRGTQSPPR